MGGVEQLFYQAVSLTGSFNLWLILTIFMITLGAEFGLGIPYLLESIWLLVGYHAIGGTISPISILICCCFSLIGREIGATMLYKISSSRYNPLSKLIKRLTALELASAGSADPFRKLLLPPLLKFVSRMFSPHSLANSSQRKGYYLEKYVRFSPFNVALGRFSWLKIPITITMGMTRKPLVLMSGVAFFSLAWDGIYITLGVFGAGGKISPVVMIACTVSSFILINAGVFFIRRYFTSRKLSPAA